MKIGMGCGQSQGCKNDKTKKKNAYWNKFVKGLWVYKRIPLASFDFSNKDNFRPRYLDV